MMRRRLSCHGLMLCVRARVCGVCVRACVRVCVQVHPSHVGEGLHSGDHVPQGDALGLALGPRRSRSARPSLTDITHTHTHTHSSARPSPTRSSCSTSPAPPTSAPHTHTHARTQTQTHTDTYTHYARTPHAPEEGIAMAPDAEIGMD